jgi:nucleolar protein 56
LLGRLPTIISRTHPTRNHQYARVAKFIGDKDSLDEDELAALLDDDTTVAQNILDAARGSMGSGLSDIVMLNMILRVRHTSRLSFRLRKSFVSYLAEKMNSVAPSLTALLGAQLISHAGSLTNLSKYPASSPDSRC